MEPRLRLIWATTEEDTQMLLRWAGSLIPHVGVDGGFPGPARVSGVIDRKNRLRAVNIFHDWQDDARTLQISGAGVGLWASPDIIRQLFFYAFVTNNSRKIWAAIPHDHERVIKFMMHLGFRQDALLRFHFSETQHACILSMMEDEYMHSRWVDEVRSPTHSIAV